MRPALHRHGLYGQVVDGQDTTAWPSSHTVRPFFVVASLVKAARATRVCSTVPNLSWWTLIDLIGSLDLRLPKKS